MFDLLESVLRTAYPGFEWVGTRAVARGLAMLVWRERGAEFDAGELSEGTLRFVWLASLLLTSRMPPLILIDEPEVSLHPDLQHALADLLMHASGRTQLVVATQSPELVSWLEPKHLVVLESDDEGWTLARSGEALNVDDWLEDYALGQLWTKGVLGGRP